jgi:hypothetical protein
MVIKPTKRRFAIGLFLLTGHTPWGVNLRGDSPRLPRCSNEWVMCCGHVLTSAEVRQWTSEGLLAPGPLDELGRETVVAGLALWRWVYDAFHSIPDRSWK